MFASHALDQQKYTTKTPYQNAVQKPMPPNLPNPFIPCFVIPMKYVCKNIVLRCRVFSGDQ